MIFRKFTLFFNITRFDSNQYFENKKKFISRIIQTWSFPSPFVCCDVNIRYGWTIRKTTWITCHEISSEYWFSERANKRWNKKILCLTVVKHIFMDTKTSHLRVCPFPHTSFQTQKAPKPHHSLYLCISWTWSQSSTTDKIYIIPNCLEFLL